MIFDDYFDKIVIISLPEKFERLKRCLSQLKEKNLSTKIKVQSAIHGESVGISDWFKWGGGAWGCMLSHMRVVEDFCMEYGYGKRSKTFSDKKILILEDDVIFCDNADIKFSNFIKVIPKKWGQLYLGGQHTREPYINENNIWKCSSVNRTHAYALNGDSAKRFHKHISYFPDYKGQNHHVDHQIEVAHRRKDWDTYAPLKWIAGQGENYSNINFRGHPNKWWDWPMEDEVDSIPFIVIDEELQYEHAKFLNLGKAYENNSLAPEDLTSLGITRDFSKKISSLAKESWEQRHLPAIKPASLKQLEKLKLLRKNGVLNLSENKDNLQNLLNKIYE